LIPLEADILTAAVVLLSQGTEEFYGYLLASEIRDLRAAKQLTAFGSLYKALDRLTEHGFLERRWDDPDVELKQSRPRRRMYRITLSGQNALRTWTNSVDDGNRPLQLRRGPVR
jgi:PadR family transcriptional regulator, regulatory protein PadR